MKLKSCLCISIVWLLVPLPVRAGAGPVPIEIATAHAVLKLAVGVDGRLYELGFGSAGKTRAVFKHPGRETEFFPQYGDGQGESFVPEELS